MLNTRGGRARREIVAFCDRGLFEVVLEEVLWDNRNSFL